MTNTTGTFPGAYPTTRLRRNRVDPWTRKLVAENVFTAGDLIWPVFVREGENTREKVPSMPGVERLSVDLCVAAAREARDLGIPVITLFPQTPQGLKSPDGAEALNPDNLVNPATRAIKSEVPGIGVTPWRRPRRQRHAVRVCMRTCDGDGEDDDGMPHWWT